MGDADDDDLITTTANHSLPPGCRFFPSDDLLLRHYLSRRSDPRRPSPSPPIIDLDLYAYAPFDLPESACFRYGRGGRRRHWYCYVAAEGGERESRERRAGGGGYWRRKGREREVVVVGKGGGVVVGTKKSFVYYFGDQTGNNKKMNNRTDWVMYEYSLLGRPPEVSFVLCRILVKLSRRCKGSDNVLSSCGEDSFATTVRDIGIQHDGNITSSFRETIVQNDDSVDKKDETQEVIVAGVELLPQEPVIACDVTRDIGDSFLLDNLTAQQLVSILEDDYIELDDLTTPLSKIDFT